MKIRVYIDDRYLKILNERYGLKFEKEFDNVPTPTQLVEIGLINLESLLSGQEFEIKLMKNGKILCKWEKI